MLQEQEEKELKNTAETSSPAEQKKRGRKSNANRTGYFYEEEEEAFKEYITCKDDKIRNRIFRQKLYNPFTTMIESIIRRYGLFVPSEEFADTFNDTLGFLITKADKFDPTKGYKAYSYCGTVCKRYLLLQRQKDMRRRDTTLSYDQLYNNGNTDDREDSKVDIETMTLNNDVIKRQIEELQDILTKGEYDGIPLTVNEEKVGYGLLELLSNWDTLFPVSSDKKFNKTSFMYFIKEFTGLPTKSVTEAMKRYKEVYFNLKEDVINE